MVWAWLRPNDPMLLDEHLVDVPRLRVELVVGVHDALLRRGLSGERGLYIIKRELLDAIEQCLSDGVGAVSNMALDVAPQARQLHHLGRMRAEVVGAETLERQTLLALGENQQFGHAPVARLRWPRPEHVGRGVQTHG